MYLKTCIGPFAVWYGRLLLTQCIFQYAIARSIILSTFTYLRIMYNNIILLIVQPFLQVPSHLSTMYLSFIIIAIVTIPFFAVKGNYSSMRIILCTENSDWTLITSNQNYIIDRTFKSFVSILFDKMTDSTNS